MDFGYRVLSQSIELVRITQDGNERIINAAPPLPPVPPLALQQIIRARLAIRDPQGISEIIYTPVMPGAGAKGAAYTTGGGIYQIYDAVSQQWEEYILFINDAYIEDLIFNYGLLKAEVLLIDFLLASLNPYDFISAHSAGAQSFTFVSFADVLNFYKQRKADILEQIAADTGNDTGRAIKTKRYAVGGIDEYEN